VREPVQEFQTDSGGALKQSENITKAVATVGSDPCHCLRLKMLSGLQPTLPANSFMGGPQNGSSTKKTATQRFFAGSGFCSGGEG
jgi:hypothetical protein